MTLIFKKGNDTGNDFLLIPCFTSLKFIDALQILGLKLSRIVYFQYCFKITKISSGLTSDSTVSAVGFLSSCLIATGSMLSGTLCLL